MSGWNKEKSAQAVSRKGFIRILGLVYLLLVLYLVVTIITIPGIYTHITKNTIEAGKQAVQEALGQKDMEQKLDELLDKTAMELVIKSGENTLYSTIPIADMQLLEKAVDERALCYMASYEAEAKGQTYQIWMAIYKLNLKQIFTGATLTLFVGSIFLCVIMTTLIALMNRRIKNPLKRLRDNIRKLKDYRLQEISEQKKFSQYDLLSEELMEFTGDLQGKLEAFTVHYTALERELQAEREKEQYQKQMVTALVHDLKAPLNISNIQVEKLKKELPADNSADADLLVHNNERVLGAVNEILYVLRQNSVKEEAPCEEIDAVAIARETLRLFRPMFQKREISASMDAPRQLPIQFRTLEFKQIMHNIISNASQYGDKDGSFELEIEQQEDKVQICAYNDKADVSTIDFDRVFDLFYHVNTTDNPFSSGVGMYTIRSTVEKWNGDCTFEPYKDGVRLIIRLPVKGGDVS